MVLVRDDASRARLRHSESYRRALALIVEIRTTFNAKLDELEICIRAMNPEPSEDGITVKH